MLSKEEELQNALRALSEQIEQVHVLLDMFQVPDGVIEERIAIYERWNHVSIG